MSITVQQRRRLARAINRFARAKVSDAWKGAGHPDDVPETERELRQAKQNLARALDDITDRGEPGSGRTLP